jgi:lysozyme
MMLNSQQLPDPSLPWPIPMAGVALIAESEGCSLTAYKCPAGVFTCGWGETAGVGPKTKWTKAYADQRFCDSLSERTEAVRAMVTVETSDNQLAALVSLAYNIGNAALAKSSVLRAHNRGDFAAAARAFALWNKATVSGKLTVLPGLVTRRAREAALYLTPDDGRAEPMPQAVAPESSLSRSPMMTAGGALPVATGVLTAAVEAAKPDPVAAVTQAGQQASTVQTALTSIKSLAVETIGIPASWWLPLVMVGAGVTVIYWRHKQRTGGWA